MAVAGASVFTSPTTKWIGGVAMRPAILCWMREETSVSAAGCRLSAPMLGGLGECHTGGNIGYMQSVPEDPLPRFTLRAGPVNL